VSVSKGHVINITNSTVRFEHILLTGGMTGGVYIKDASTVTLGSGAALKKNDGAFGALIIDSGCTVTMQDNAEISENTSMRGAGSTVWGTLIMKDNAVIKDNRANAGTDKDGKSDRGQGGGVYVEDGKLVMQDNAVISANKAHFGAGIYNWDGTITMEGNAKITGNSVVRSMEKKYGGNGGGLYIQGASATVTLSGHAILSENKAGYGAGIYMYEGKVTLQDDASVSNNSIVRWKNSADEKDVFGDDAAGIMVNDDCTLTMEGQSVISGNDAGSAGGGVYVINDATAIFIQKGGSITDNSATMAGGLYLGVNAVHTQTGGSITGNESKSGYPDIYRATE
jgi:hypothetical protein